MFKRNRLSVFLILVLLLCFLAACGQEQPAATTDSTTDTTTIDSTESNTTTVADTTDDENVLRIVTDKSGKFSMNDLVKELISDFEDTHPDISVELEILPDDVEERNIRLESLRAAIMSGDGPDVFLFPTTASYQTELVFQDVAQSMHNGMFADISALYDADTELNKEQLQSTVMEAGVLDGARYVLPLWFSYGTLLIDSEKLTNYGITEDEVSGNIDDLYRLIISRNDYSLAVGTTLESLGAEQLFPHLVDYDTNQILITAEEIAESTKLYYQHQALIYREHNLDEVSVDRDKNRAAVNSYVSFGEYWRNGSKPMHIDNLHQTLRHYVISQAGGHGELKVIPLRSADGSVTAKVTYWGAVSAGCDKVELAYEFLRTLLSENAQWEIGRSSAGVALSGFFYGMGYPVRVQGSVEHLTTSVINMGSQAIDPDNLEESRARFEALEQVVLTDDNFPLLDVEIGHVRFPIMWESNFARQRSNLMEYEPFSVPTDEEIDEWAKELVRELEFHIAEG